MNTSVVVDVGHGNAAFPLEVRVDVSATHGAGTVNPTTSSDVIYQFEIADRERGGLNTTARTTRLHKVLDEGAVGLHETVRRQVANLVTTEFRYDLRALFYAMGDLAGRTVANRDWPEDLARTPNVTPHATRVRPDSLVLVPVTRSPRVVAYMVALGARMCGLDEVVLGAEQYMIAERPRNAETKRRYINHVMQQLQADVIHMNVYGEHMFAFFRGLNRHITLRSHSEEGGWIRDAFATATYPRPKGFISARIVDVGEMVRFKSPSTNERTFVSDLLGHMLTCASCVADADPASEFNLTSVHVNHLYEGGVVVDDAADNDQQRPSAISMVKDVLDVVENHTVMMLARSDLGAASEGHNGLLPRNTFGTYLANDAVDRHFDRPEILPYAYVENGVVLKHPSSVRAEGPRAGREVELELFGGPPIVPKRYTRNVTRTGHHSAAKVYFQHRDTGLRQMGAFYLGGGPFGRNDLQSARLVTPGVDKADAILCRDDHTTLASMHWVRPHCPVPMPGECSVWSGRALIEVTTSRHSNLRTGLCESVYLNVGEPRSVSVLAHNGGRTRIRRNVNNHYRTVMNISELSDDEEIQQEMFELLDDHIAPRLADGREGFVGLEGAEDEDVGADGGGPDHRAEQLAPPRAVEGGGPPPDAAETPETDGVEAGEEV